MGVFSFLVLCYLKRFLPRIGVIFIPRKTKKRQVALGRASYPLSTCCLPPTWAHLRHLPPSPTAWLCPPPPTSWDHMPFVVIILINPPTNLVWEVLLSHFSDENLLELNLWFKSHPGTIVRMLGQRVSGPVASLWALQKEAILVEGNGTASTRNLPHLTDSKAHISSHCIISEIWMSYS